MSSFEDAGGRRPSGHDTEEQRLTAGLAVAHRGEVDVRRQSSLNAWVSFTVTFVLLRLLTYGIRYGLLPFHNVVTRSGLHIHHFVWGILILLVVGFAGYMVDDIRWHPWLAAIFGIGAALVIDEFALWLNLRDVYWAQQGRWSVDLAVVVGGLLGLLYAAERRAESRTTRNEGSPPASGG